MGLGIYGIPGVYLRYPADMAGTTYISPNANARVITCISITSNVQIAILVNSSVSTFTAGSLLHLGKGSDNNRPSPVACLQHILPENASTHIPSCLTLPTDLKRFHAREDKGHGRLHGSSHGTFCTAHADVSPHLHSENLYRNAKGSPKPSPQVHTTCALAVATNPRGSHASGVDPGLPIAFAASLLKSQLIGAPHIVGGRDLQILHCHSRKRHVV